MTVSKSVPNLEMVSIMIFIPLRDGEVEQNSFNIINSTGNAFVDSLWFPFLFGSHYFCIEKWQPSLILALSTSQPNPRNYFD